MEAGHSGERARTSRKGGLRPIPFIIANEMCERVVSTGINANIIIYLTRKYHLGSATSAMVNFVYQAAANFLPVGGAVVSDALLGRFLMVTLTLFACTIGTTLLWLTAMVPDLTPPDCEPEGENCRSPTKLQLLVLFTSFLFMSIGASGIRPCCLAFGEDQLSHWDAAQKDRALRGLFSWYYVSVGGSYIIATTFIVYFQDKLGWKVGFAVPVGMMALVTLLNLLASPLYVKLKPQKSLWVSLVQVAVVAFKNRHIRSPETTESVQFYNDKGMTLVPSRKMRSLNKACVVQGDHREPGGDATDPWSICTVEHVEHLKSALSVTPMWSAMMLSYVILGQTFGVLQAATMDRRIGATGRFQIPAGSISIFEVTTFTLWSGCYDKYILPVLRRLTGRRRGPVLTLKQRMGIGVALSIATALVASRVEFVRRRRAIAESLAEPDAEGFVHMSALWLAPQYVLAGLAGSFASVGQLEFYYAVLPKSMGSFVLALLFLGAGVGNIVATVIVKVVKVATSVGGTEGWLANNLNQGRYDHYYLLLASLGAFNLVYFLFICYVFEERTLNLSLEAGGSDGEEMGEIRG